MNLVRGKTYKHRSGFKGIYSHSDELDHNHFFKATENPKDWKVDELDMISFPTWDLHRNITPE